MAFHSILIAVVLLVAAAIASRIGSSRKSKADLGKRLPGPKGLPIIGSVHELPAKCSWMKFHEWGVKYGPIYQVNLAGSNHIFLSRDEVAHDLMSKRSSIYSDRPFIPGLEQDNRISGQYLPLMSHNLLWSRQRRFAKQIMDKSSSESFYDYPELESIRLLFELMADPSKYNVALESFVARVTARLAWGTSAPADELKQRARELLIGVSPSGALGNKLPAVMSLPEWMSPAKAWEARRSRTEKSFFERMQQEVKDTMAQSTEADANRSWMSMFLKNQSLWGFSSSLEGAFAVGMHGIAGALTIAAPMQSFCLALCHYPQYQPILHEEIERVLGDRMPTQSDMPDMPVLRAFIRETLRWRPAVPTGIPHQVIKDDNYKGYHIPAGSTVHAFEWSISRDPEVFTDPDAFNPLRWLDASFPTFREPLTNYPTITSYSQFGYGRRVCQGQGVVDADLFVGLGSVAWLFSIHAESGTPVNETTAIAAAVQDYMSHVVGQSSDTSSQASSTGSFSSDDDLLKSERQRLHHPMMTLFNDSAISIPGEFPKDDKEESFDSVLSWTDSSSETSGTTEPCEAVSATSSTLLGRQEFLHNLPVIAEVSEEAAETVYDVQTTYDCPPQDPVMEAPIESAKSSASYENDPTMNFSTLLIAKPMPFKFQLRIRNQDRAEYVARQWIKKEMEGEFQEAKVYWKNGTAGDAECGWGKVFA